MFASWTKTLLESETFPGSTNQSDKSDIKVSCDCNNHSLPTSPPPPRKNKIAHLFSFLFILLKKEIKGNWISHVWQFASHGFSFSRPALILIFLTAFILYVFRWSRPHPWRAQRAYSIKFSVFLMPCLL